MAQEHETLSVHEFGQHAVIALVFIHTARLMFN